MKRRVAFTILLAMFGLGIYLSIRNRVGFLILNRHASIEVNGRPVPASLLRGNYTAVLTTRDSSKAHSYVIHYVGDIDAQGDIGSVVDCHGWVAPRLPLVFETADYPPCGRGNGEQYVSLLLKSTGEEFSTYAGDVIRIRRYR